MKISAGLLLLAVAAASPEIKYFQYERPLQTSSGQSCLMIDTGIFSHAAPRLADLRLYRDGTETPYALNSDVPATPGTNSISPLNPGSRDGQAVFDANMPDGPYSDLQLGVTGQNFIATVTVSGSQAESGAETRIGSYTIFDLTGQKLGRSTVLHLPQSDFRYLHFSIKGPIQPQSVTGVSVVRLAASQPKYLTVSQSAQVTQKGHTSVYEFTVAARIPVSQILFAPESSAQPFSRDVLVSVEPIHESHSIDRPGLSRQVTARGNILRVHSVSNGQRIDEERLAIDAPWVDLSSPTRWTVSIENGDDAPLRLESVQLQMLERDLCFDAAAGGSYVLYYGDPALPAPRYDYATLFAPQPNASYATAGVEQLNPAYQPRPDDRPFTEKHPALLWLALAAVILLLGIVALRSAKPPAQAPK